MAIEGISEEKFREILRRHLTPGRAISSQEYLRGRETKLRQIDRAFNSDGKHIFIHGDRGVGKTSLGRTAAFIHASADGDPAMIECEKANGAYQLLRDIALRCVPPCDVLGAKTSKRTFKAGIPLLGGDIEEEVKRGHVPEMRSINEALAIIAYVASLNRKQPVVVIDEFDIIEDVDTRHTLASFLKHVSDQELGIRFIICGIGDSLDEMIGAHQSSGRYLMPIPLERLPHDARWEIISTAAEELKVYVDENSIIRIGQVSDGFPYYVHLIGEKLFWSIYDDPQIVRNSEPKHFEKALLDASEEAEPSLKRAYELATQKYTNEYDKVLWAVADNSSLRRQIKDIYDSYKQLMGRHFKDKEVMEQSKFYNRMSSLRTERHGEILRTTSAGWYEFRENRLRGYVRLAAERENVELEPEHYLASRARSSLQLYSERFDR
jgi:hypothetical protein